MVHFYSIDLYTEGWAPSTAISDPVIWRRREQNKLADFLCNTIMDSRESWLQEVPDSGWQSQNVVIFSDGGVRSVTVAAAAWSMGYIRQIESGDFHFTLIAARGIFINFPVSSFLAEAMASADAAEYLRGFLLRVDS